MFVNCFVNPRRRTTHWLMLAASATLLACGTTPVTEDGDAISAADIDLNDIDLDGVDVDQDTLSKLDIKLDTSGEDTKDSGGTDAEGTDTASGTDATSGTDTADSADSSDTAPEGDTADSSDTAGSEDTAGDTAAPDTGCTSAAQCADDNPCTDDGCMPDGTCVHALNSGAACDDGDACTKGDACDMGTCVGGKPSDCNDENPCTDDSCDKATGCVNLANTATCEDGFPCTTGDTCTNKACVGTANNAACDDENVCTDDTCDPTKGCVNLANAATCDDGFACTLADACTESVCTGTADAAKCNDGSPCTDDSCDPAKGCIHLANASTDTCNDENPCTVNDACDGGGLCTGAPNPCEDDNMCTVDLCDAATGCTHAPLDGSGCSDGDACTFFDVCKDSACVGTKPTPCDDGNACTNDSCDSAKGCQHELLTGPTCDDGAICTIGEACSGGFCMGGVANACSDDNPCTDDSCDDQLGGCINMPNSAACTDGDPCTDDICFDKACKSTPKVCGPTGYEYGAPGQQVCAEIGYCDYADGQCKTTTNFVWLGDFGHAPWKTTGDWQVGLAVAQTTTTDGQPDPSTDTDGDGYLAGTVIGDNINFVPHDYYYLTSPVVDLSGFATSTYLDGSTYDKSLIMSFSWYSSLSLLFGASITLEYTADGQTWEAQATPDPGVTQGWSWGYIFLNKNDPIIPKKFWTNKFQVRFGYKIDNMMLDPLPITSGLSIDSVQIGVGNCWD